MSSRIYAAHTVPGLERVSWEEAKSVLAGASLLGIWQGLFLFTYDGPASQLLKLRSTEDIFAVIFHRVDLPSTWRGIAEIREGLASAAGFDAALAAHREAHPRAVKRVTFRVVAQMRGRHAFRRIDAQQAAIEGLEKRCPRWKLVAEQAHLEIWLDIQDGLCVCMLRLSDRQMRHRQYKLAHIPASLRPTIAYAMVFLSKPEEGDVFVDPMCGAGTVLLERVHSGGAKALIGGDLDPTALAAAQINAARYPRIALCRWDATHLPLPDGSVDKVVSNLPFGKQIGSPASNRALYKAFFEELERVMSDAGRAVLLTSEEELVESLLQDGGFSARRRVSVVVLGQKATIYVLERAG